MEIEQPTNEATKEQKMDGIKVLLKCSRNFLSIQDVAIILGSVFDDCELISLIKEIKNI